MAGARRFEDLIVWQLSVRVRDRIDVLVESGRAARDFKFRDQIRDSSAARRATFPTASYALIRRTVRIS
jgi:hypothetical protein